MTTQHFDVPEISCSHCVTAISTSVGRIDGVTAVDVDIDAKAVTVRGTASRDAVCAAIEDAGYDVAC
ncbi:MAG TPA: copper ion binding protein [Jiangellales bacterium]|nr:copper ion binding protein [Jiangellales bacterium]